MQNLPNNSKALFSPIKLFTCFTALVGCVTIIAAPFYLPFVNLLGLLGTAALSAACLLLFSYVSYNGFAYLNQYRNDVPLFLQAIVYSVAVTLQIVAIVSALRLLNAGCHTFLHADLQFIQLPQ
jgi:hypothetical protein